MAKLWKNHESIFAKVENYFAEAQKACEVFRKTFKDLMYRTAGVDVSVGVEEVHKAEHAADEKRWEIILELYKKALIPGSRGDILGVLSIFDKLPNTFRAVCNEIYTKNIVFPEQFREKMIKLADVNIEAFTAAKDAAMCLFKESDLMDKCDIIQKKENESDRLEAALIKDIFASDINLAEKMLFEHIVSAIGNISNVGEEVAERIELAIIKRSI